jgi:hypothetical protein
LNRFSFLIELLPSLARRAPFVAWINAADPVPANPNVTLADAQEEPSAFLIPTNEADDLDQPGKR